MMLLCVYVYIFIINSNVLKCSFSYMVVSVWVCFGDRCVQRVLRTPVLRMRLDEGGKPIGVIVFLSIRACHLRQVGPNSLRPHLRHLHLMPQLSCDCHVWRWWFKQVGEHVQTCSNMFKHVQTTRNQFATLIAVKAQIKGRLGHKPRKSLKKQNLDDCSRFQTHSKTFKTCFT